MDRFWMAAACAAAVGACGVGETGDSGATSAGTGPAAECASGADCSPDLDPCFTGACAPWGKCVRKLECAGGGGAGGAGGAPPGGAGGSSGGSAGGGAGGAPGCPDPLLTYDPAAPYSNPIGPYTDEYGGFFAGRFEPFAVDTTCAAVLVGLAEFSGGFCAVPAAVGATAWGSPTADPELVPASPTPQAPSSDAPLGDSADAHLLRFEQPHSFKAGEWPFVGVQLQKDLCVAGTRPTCDLGRLYRYRPAAPGAGWAPVAEPKPDDPAQIPSVQDQLAFGLADCTPD